MPLPAFIHILAQGWRFKQTDSSQWLPVAKVPTNVHLDLQNNRKIQDPFIGFNELDCEWVGEQSWTYGITLPSISRGREDTKHVLAFDGLDTFATVTLNGEIILESDNMFVMHRIDITEKFIFDAENVLEIEFKSALLEARKIKDAHPEHKWVGSNGEMARLAVRKAQYHWGWDWGPFLMTCGPWREVRLETYHSRIDDLWITYEVDNAFQSVRGRMTAVVEEDPGAQVRFSAALGDTQVFEAIATADRDGTAQVEFVINKPRLWFPHGYGEQNLYTVAAEVISKPDQQCLHSSCRRIGFRKAELIQDVDDIGKTFYFRINGIDIFCGGSDWIPADSFTPRLSISRYRQWLQMIVDGHQSMIRVWGGGIWEDDAFYDTCDELGILVWQDFMFACGNYPAYPSMLQSIEAEAVCQTKRLRHHPCLVIYAGNNEDYQIQEQFGLTYDFEDKNPESWLETDFPARYIYEKLLPEIVAKHSGHIVYHPGSPWGDGKPTSDRTIGDMHQWNVWHGTQEKYQIYAELGGRFNSEFGMEAFPHMDTIEHFVTDPAQLYPQSRMLDFHNKAAGHERRIATYLVENFRTQTDLAKFVHLTQLSQAEALMFGYRGWRRQWGQKRFCGGALVWQLNDCWPVTSWAIADYFLRKKPAWYAMRRCLAPVAVAVKRAHHDWSVVHAKPAREETWECWVSSSKTGDMLVTVELRFVSIATGKDIKKAIIQEGVRVQANGSTDVLQGTINNVNEEPHVLAARLLIDGQIISRDVDWPQPLKYLDFSDRGVEVEAKSDSIKVKVRKPTKGLVFEEREGVLISDSALDVVPGDDQTVFVKGLGAKDKTLNWTYLDAP